MNRKQRRAARKQMGTPGLVGMRGGGPLPQANEWTLLALQNAFLALNSAIETLSQVPKVRPEEFDAGSQAQAYHIGRVHMSEEAVNLLDGIRTQVFLTHSYGAPRFMGKAS